jgi:hypothetical protein
MKLQTRPKNRYEIVLFPDDCQGRIIIEVTQTAARGLNYGVTLPAGKITEVTVWGAVAQEFLQHLPEVGSFHDVIQAQGHAMQRAEALFQEERADIPAEVAAKN